MSLTTVKLEKQGSVLRVKLARPEVRNAFNEKVIADLHQIFSTTVHEPDVRAVVIEGEGDVFCAGGDLNWMGKAINVDFSENLKDTRALAEVFSIMNACPKPLIGKLHGAAIGGGVGLTAVCDLVIASKETIFSLSEVRLGVVPACIGPFVIAKIGASHARALFMSAERFRAEKALQVGLIHQIVDSADALEPAVKRSLEHMLQAGPNAVSVAKKLVLDLTWPDRMRAIPNSLDYVAEVLAKIRISAEGQEGVKAFLEKRKPNWLEKSEK